MTLNLRVAIIAEFAERLGGSLGRTGVMKLTFFLQELKDVSLGYSYRIYTYGPYDSQVLSDLKVADAIGFIKEEQFEWDGGSGYIIKFIKKPALSDEEKNSMAIAIEHVNWVASEFGGLSAADLEIESTAFYVAKMAEKDRVSYSSSAIARAVRSIKPRHTEERIVSHVKRLKERGIIKSSLLDKISVARSN